MKGAKIISGERWLLHQAIEAFKLFIGDNPSLNIIEKGLQKKLTKENLNVLNFPNSSLQEIIDKKADLIISTKGLTDAAVKEILDEESRKAFGS
jgi:hypothetical protein